MATENKKIGQKIKKARLSMSLTQSQLGKTLGVTGSAIGYLEAGLRKISPDVLKKIADNLNKPFKYFYEENGEKYDLFSKIMGLKKQLDDVAETVEKVEKEKFELKDFYESIIDEAPKIIVFLDDDEGISFLNKKAKVFFNIPSTKATKKIRAKTLIPELDNIYKKKEREIKTNTLFDIQTKKKNFLAKSVYDKSGKYRGIWIIEQ